MSTQFLKLLESRFFFYLASIVFKMLLDYSYFEFVNPLFDYAGYHVSYDSSNYIVSWLCTIVVVFATPNILKNVSDYFLVTFCFSIILPMLSLYGANSTLSFYPIIVNIIVFSFLSLGLRLNFFKTSIKYPYVKNGSKIFKVFCSLMILYLVFWYIVSGAVSNFNLNLSEVYEYRDENAELTNVGITAYLNTWVLKVINLVMIAYALLKKQKKLLILLVLLQVFFYGVSAHKSVLFYPLIIYSIYFYFNKTKSLATVPLAFSIVITICMYSYLFYDNVFLGSLFIRRVFFAPNSLSFTYFEFFSNHSFAYWTNSFSIFGSKVYPEGIPTLIGSYLNRDGLRANNGSISSGYANAGLIGVFIYSVIILIILKVINQLSNDIGKAWFGLCIVITPLRTLIISSDLLTVLLTHGLLLAILLLFLIRNPRHKI